MIDLVADNLEIFDSVYSAFLASCIKAEVLLYLVSFVYTSTAFFVISLHLH